MKQNLLYIIVTILLFSSYGCKKFLNITPQSNTGTVGNFYKNETDIQYALTAAYADLQNASLYRDNLVLMTDVRSDDLSSFANAGSNAGREYSIKIFSAQSDNQIFRNVWAKTYETIYRCNNVIKYVPVVGNTKLRAQYEAEARFIRALCYFNIVRLWGDAPLILTPLSPEEIALSARSKTSAIYATIESDLLFASDVNNLAKSFSGANLGRATSLAAAALLAKVYIQQKKWNDATQLLEKLIKTDNAGTYQLLPDIANVFSTAPPHGSSASVFATYTGWKPQTMNKEILFEVLFNKDITNEGRNALVYYTNQADINEVFKISSPSCLYKSQDRRSDLMLSMRGTNNDNNLLVKYADIQNSQGQFGYNIPILRWSDVLLMYAESLNEVSYNSSEASPALKALNDVRTRSCPTCAYSTSELPDQSAFRSAVLLERRLEFPMEMQRWFDLLRTNEAIKAIQKIGITINQKDLLFPIPNSEVVLRNDPINFPQNPGY